ncbi:MAG: glycolate oxidase subunit GlcE [Gammaproteobacteria bacterium]
MPTCRVFEEHRVIEHYREQILAAAADKRALRIRAGGTKDWYGQEPAGEVLDVRGHSGIVAYEPSELVITAKSGTPLADIEAALAEHGQCLAFEPPHFGAGATLGGAIASGLSGPRRAYAGAVRDFVLGATLMDGKGEVLNFGGQVMKNVAGYDVARLLAGSLGTLGLMLQHSIKVLPHQPSEATLRFEMPETQALLRLNEWGGQPLPLSASCWHAGVLTLRLSGAQAAVQAAVASLGGERIDGQAFWASLREQQHAFFEGETAWWRVSLPSTAAPLGLDAPQLIEWGGAQRWLRMDAAVAPTLRAQVAALGGHATLFRPGGGGDRAVGVFHPLAPAVAKIHTRLKAAFDPAGVFNPGRMG